MKKKQYIYPMTDVLSLNTSKMMAFTDTSEYVPPHVGNDAPARRTNVF